MEASHKLIKLVGSFFYFLRCERLYYSWYVNLTTVFHPVKALVSLYPFLLTFNGETEELIKSYNNNHGM